MKKMIISLLVLSFASLSFGQNQEISPEMRIEVKKVLAKTFGYKKFRNYYLIGKIKSLRQSKRFHGHRLHQVILDTAFTCAPYRQTEVKEQGYCSVILTKSFRKGSRWVGVVDQDSPCSCGSAVIH